MEDWELEEINSLEENGEIDIQKQVKKEKYKETITEEEIWEQDPFTALMFGSQAANQRLSSQRNGMPSNVSPVQQQKQGVNYEELMVNIDKLVESAKGLKPLFQQIFPYIEQIWKKK